MRKTWPKTLCPGGCGLMVSIEPSSRSYHLNHSLSHQSKPIVWRAEKPAEPIGRRTTWNLATARVGGVTWIYRNRQWVSPEEVTR